MPVNELSCGSTVFSNVASTLGSMVCTDVLLQASPSNAESVLLGNSSTQTIRLSAGATLTVPISNLNQLSGRVSTNASAVVNWITNTRVF
jgi:hypothetical protein